MNSVSFEVGFTKRYRIYSMNSWVYLSSLHSADPFFSIKIMKNNSDYSILERFRISLKFALFYMLFVSFMFLLRGIESIISYLDIIFVWSLIFSTFFWTRLGRRLRHFMDKVCVIWTIPMFWTVVAMWVFIELWSIVNNMQSRTRF